MRAKLIAAALITQILFCQIAFAQQRGGGVRVVKTNVDGSIQEVQLYDGSYALVIGNSEYLLGWERLSGVRSDVIAVRNILEKHGFKVEAEENLTSAQFEQRLRKFINDYGYDRDNRLIIYYAGHGYTLNSAGDKRELGYIIPSDTPLPTKDERGFRQKAISMYTIQTFAKEIQAKHALFAFDSCFSGKLFALRDTLKLTPFIVDKVNYPVRQFITAGNETQTVPDESIFRRAFVRGLEGDADRNNDAYITGTELADYLKEAVTNYTNRRQTPQYGTINDIDLDRGDLVFVVPKPVKTVSISPTDRAKADALAQKALVKMKSAELEEAADLATEALSLDPGQALALAVRGHSREWLPNKKEYGQSAEDDLQEAVRLEPYNSVYRAWLGNLSPDEDEKKEIQKLFATPKSSLEFYGLGINHLWLDGDATPFDEAIKLEPKFTIAYFERGMLSADGPRYPHKAYDDMTVVIGNLHKDNTIKGIAYYIRAAMGNALHKDSYFVISDFSKAIQILGSQKENPYLAASYQERAETYLILGRFDEAISDYSILINLMKWSSAFNYHKRAKVYFAKGDYQNAISDCTQAIIISSDERNRQGLFSGFYTLRADAYEKIGRKDLADVDRNTANSLRQRSLGNR